MGRMFAIVAVVRFVVVARLLVIFVVAVCQWSAARSLSLSQREVGET